MTESLGHKQIAAMLTLMTVNRELSNPQLRELLGFTLTGPDRKRLNDLKLVESTGTPFVHTLTDAGWAWCEKELGRKQPERRPRSVLGVTLYVVLNGLGEYLRREHLRPADVFEPGVELTPDEIERRVRTAYRKLARSPRDWVRLADLRPMLGDAPARDADAVLKQLSRTRQANLVPESDRRALTPADHEAAIRLGGEDNHLISIEVPR